MAATSKEALKQMSKPTRAVVRILENNWSRIRKSCNYENSDGLCPLGDECSFANCPLLSQKENGREKNGGKEGRNC